MSAGNNRGVALIITLMAITIIIAVTLELNRQMRQSLSSAAANRNYMTLSHMVSAGVGVGEAVLVKDKNDTGSVSVQDEWADPEMMRDYLSQLPFDDGDITLKITDERSRLQLNALVEFPGGQAFNSSQQRIWQRFFSMLFDAEEVAGNGGMAFLDTAADPTPDMIINPVKDWLDSGDDDAITGLTGAEEAYYQSRDPSYGCRNGPFKHIRELMRVKNIDEEMFYRFDIDNYVTVYGMTPVEGEKNRFTYDGKININTAEMPIIAALLPEGYAYLAEEMVAFREETVDGNYVNDLTQPDWYQSIPGGSDIEIDPDLITTQSDLFRIECRAEYDDMTLSATVIVRREKDEETGKWLCRTLNWSYQEP